MPMDYDLSTAFRRIEDELISSMMRNLSRHRAEETAAGFQWSQWQTEQLAALSDYSKQGSSKFSKRYFSALNSKIGDALKDSYSSGETTQEAAILRAIQSGSSARQQTDTLGGSFFRTNERKLNALVKATTDDMEQAETAVLRRANDAYRKIIYDAQVYANTGAGTYEKAVDMATKDFLAAGIQCVEYSNGARHTLSDYADMAIKTASKRAYLQGEGDKRQEWGVSTVIVNKRGNACPKCARFCGKVFIDDVWSGGKRSDGNYPLLSAAIAQGLYHPRCKDSHSTWFPELHQDATPYTKQEITELEGKERAEQRQQYAQRQAEKYRRMEKYSLDGDNQRKYGNLAEQWEQEMEQGKRTEQERNAVISPSIKTAEYRRKIDRLGEDVDTSRTIWQQAKQMLEHRSGTLYEDLAFINSATGDALLQDTYNVERACLPTKRMKAMLLNSEPYTVIAVHNHPGSSVPSKADLKAAFDCKYKYGVVVCHNGVIFKYSVKKEFSTYLVNAALDRLQNALYNEIGSVEDILKEFADMGISMEVIS
ncbi:MAG: phage minor capsid protein [Clostridiales bacterium]|nr:phage minor capsid protein [Clostridiales bacterium]